MTLHRLTLLAAAATLSGAVAAAPRSACAAGGGSSLALPAVTVAAAPDLHAPGTRLDAIRQYPRYRPYARRQAAPAPRSFLLLHGGVFDPEDPAADHRLVGFRAGQSHDLLSVGVAADWAHRSFNEETVVAQTVDPTGHVITQSVETMHTSSHLLPMMAFLQISGPANLPLRPYFGVGGGYELLFLNSEDFTTGEEHSGTFGGWGWQAWGGAALPLGPRTQLTGEVFANTATVRRDVERFDVGQPVRESVDVDGVGMRVGLQFGY